MIFGLLKRVFWALTASITLEVKNNYDHVTMKRIFNKMSEINFLYDVWFDRDADYFKFHDHIEY